MQRIMLASFASVLFLASASAQEPAGIPDDVQEHMKQMVGSWTFNGTQGERKFSGAEEIRLINNKTTLIQEGHFDLTDGKKEHYVILSGWDGSKKTVLVRGFTSEGYSWAGEWKKLKAGKWEGNASGQPASFELKGEWMRYEDAGEGTPWISVFKRKQAKE